LTLERNVVEERSRFFKSSVPSFIRRFLSNATAIADSAHQSVAGQKRTANVEQAAGLLSNLIGETSVTQRWVVSFFPAVNDETLDWSPLLRSTCFDVAARRNLQFPVPDAPEYSRWEVV